MRQRIDRPVHRIGGQASARFRAGNAASNVSAVRSRRGAGRCERVPFTVVGDHRTDRRQHGGDDRQRHQRFDQGKPASTVRAAFAGQYPTPPVSQLTRTSNPIPGRATRDNAATRHSRRKRSRSICRRFDPHTSMQASHRTVTSLGKRRVRPVTPEPNRSRSRIDLRRHLYLPTQRRIAICFQQGRGLHRVALELCTRRGSRNRRRMMAASKPMMASTPQDLDQRETRWPACSARAAGNVGCRSTAALLTVRPERDDFVRRALARRTIDISCVPRDRWALRHREDTARSSPARCCRAVNAARPSLGVGDNARGQDNKIERAGKAFDLDFRRLGLGLAEIVQHPRPTSAMINPMIVITTRISTSVKPACRRRDRRRVLLKSERSAHSVVSSNFTHLRAFAASRQSGSRTSAPS